MISGLSLLSEALPASANDIKDVSSWARRGSSLSSSIGSSVTKARKAVEEKLQKAKKNGRGANDLEPSSEAVGPHTTYRTDSQKRVIHYATWKEAHPRDPARWREEKRVDMVGASHYDKKTRTDVPTPHVHIGDGARPPHPDEVPHWAQPTK